MRKEEIIKELESLTNIDEMKFSQDVFSIYKYEHINDYLQMLSYRSKPEGAMILLINYIIKDIFKMDSKTGLKDIRNKNKILHEIFVEGSFIEIVINEPNNNNLCIELKPLFKFDRDKQKYKKQKLDYDKHQEQIQKYLRHRRVEYVLLTNLDDAFLFNRNAILEYKPVAKTTFVKILKDYLLYNSFWDTIRRIEDNLYFSEIGDEFFQDLKKWYNDLENIKFLKSDEFSKEEMIVQFLNKFIFIKTLEDFGLVDYHFIQYNYEYHANLWSPKGDFEVLNRFFEQIEQFFEMFYDTELFSRNFFDFLSKDKNNLNLFRTKFEDVLGFDNWSQAYGKGLIHYNYRKIDEDIFGKAYETWIAENKKDEGIYYTHTLVTKYMAKKIVDSLFDEPLEAIKQELKKSLPDENNLNLLMNNLKNIRIIDSTSGSGSFIIKVIKLIYEKYRELNDATKWISNITKESIFDNLPENIGIIEKFRDKYFKNGNELKIISTMVLNHIFLTDKDERAIETAKTNIWKESIKLKPALFNYRILQEDKVHILPNLSMNLITGDALTDIDFDEQTEFITLNFQSDVAKLHSIRNEYLNEPYNPEILDNITKIKTKIRKKLIEHFKTFDDALFFCLEFFFCYFDENGEPLPVEERGFDGIISNPPWEAAKPIQKEFAKKTKSEMDVLDFKKWFNDKLEQDSEFKQEWDKYKSHYQSYVDFLYSKYNYQGSADPNFYKFFMERDFQLIKNNGFYALLVPSGFQTDEGSADLRKLIIDENTLLELSSFENRGYKEAETRYKTKIFPDVDNRFKFSIVFAKKELNKIENYKFKARFYLQNPNDLDKNDFIEYDSEKISRFSPDNHSIMEFRTEKDYDVCLKIAGAHTILKHTGFVLRSEFHMTNDSDLFISEKEQKEKNYKNNLRLYEGKMLHQYNSAYNNERYYINEKEARAILQRKVLYRIKNEYNLSNDEMTDLIIPDDLTLDYQTYRLVYRAIGSSTNERSLISTILPENVFVGHSLNHFVNINYKIEDNKIISDKINYQDLLYLNALFNSLTLNYFIRNKISANLTMNFVYELPIAESDDKQKGEINNHSLSLLVRKSNRKEYIKLISELNMEINETDLLTEIRAKIEVKIARELYGLTLEDWKHITSTFTYGEGSDTKTELNEIIKLSIENWDKY